MHKRRTPKIRFSLAAKFNLLTIALILVTAAGICLLMIRLEMTNYYNELINHGKTIADTTAKNCEFGIYTENESLLLPILTSLSRDAEIAYVSVMSREQRTLASRAFHDIVVLPERAMPIRENSEEVLYGELFDKRNNRTYVEILSPLVSGATIDITDVLSKENGTLRTPTVIGYVRLGLSQESLQKRIKQLIASSILITVMVVLVGIGFTILWTRKITSPLKRLMRATQEISEGHFDTPFKIRTSDEISDLAHSFDHMRERLHAYHAQVEERIAEEQRHLLEKEKLMMDLHDGVGGITTNINILSELAQKTDDIANLKKTLFTIAQLSREGVTEIRSFMQSLDSKELTWHALASEIRKQGAGLMEPHRIHFSAETDVHDDAGEQPGSLLWLNLLRIYKEALTNVIKHSQTDAVAVNLRVNSQGLLLSIQDAGIGWGKQVDTGRGLPNMRKRAEEIGGRMTLSTAGKGAQVSLEIPFPIQYAIPSQEL
jgi:signal transduction histidine kinase